MAQTKYAELSKLSREDLMKKIESLRDEATVLARNTKTGEVQNVRAYVLKRRELARALTALNQAATKGDN